MSWRRDGSKSRVGHRWWGLLAVLALGTVAACGDDDDGDDAAPEPDPTEQVTEPPDDEDGDEEAAEEVPVGAAVEPRPSRGCGSSEVEAGFSEETLELEDADHPERRYLRQIPPAHDGEVPVPLVVDLHGYGEGADLHTEASALGDYGDEEGFVTVTPHGEGRDDIPFWVVAPEAADATEGVERSEDVAFLGHMLDDLEDELCLDLARVYVAGLSNGAMMTSVVACTLDDRVAAVAPVAGAMHIEDCSPERAVPVVAFHGTDDQFILYEGGSGPAAEDLPGAEDTDGPVAEASGDLDVAVPDVLARWAERNGCADPEDPTEEEQADDVTLLEWDCEPGTEVLLYRIEDGGHTWPGSELFAGLESVVGPTTMSISANEAMWEFFQEQSLPPPVPPEPDE